MNKLIISLWCLCFSISIQAQTNISQLDFCVGSGTDTTMLLIDFKDDSFDSCYAWGYIYSGSKTGEDLLNAIAAADVNLEINIDTASFGNFLQDIKFIQHEGLGGAPDYWSSWDGPDQTNLTSNSGIATPLVSGGVFGVSYTDFNPAIAPGAALAAYNPAALSFAMVSNWYGNGMDSLLMIIDFADSTDTTSYVWGYLFNDSISYLKVLHDLDSLDPDLSVLQMGAVTSITYKSLNSIVGAVSDWYVWEAENFGNWRLRYVDLVYLHPGDFGAVVFTRFLKPIRPGLPSNINQSIGLSVISGSDLSVYPNPFSHRLQIDGEFQSYRLMDLNGRVLQESIHNELNAMHLHPGLFLLEIIDQDGQRVLRKMVKH